MAQFFYRADENDTLWVHIWEAYVALAPVSITNAALTLWDPATTATDIYAVEFNVVNQDTANASVLSVGQATSGTALTSPNIWYNAQSLAAKAESGWQGPYIIPGTFVVNGESDADDRAAIHFRIKKAQDTTPPRGVDALRGGF